MSIEKQIFSYESTKELEVFDNVYFDVTLNRSIGKFKSGDKFKFAILDLQENNLTLIDNKDKVHKFDLRINIDFFEQGE